MFSVLQNSDYFTNLLPANLFVKSATLLKYVHLTLIFKHRFQSVFPYNVNKIIRLVNGLIPFITPDSLFLYSSYIQHHTPHIIDPVGT